MNIYYNLRAVLPTNRVGGVRKVCIEIMPEHMAYYDVVYDAGGHEVIIENEQGYQKGYDAKTARELLIEIYSKSIRMDYITFFEKTKSGFLKQIDSPGLE